jgi:NAD(P)-dependent dehydrogenase (short-subunit alcohol dehydrogenase family)
MTPTNKVILIVGGAAGIGKATAEVCAEHGATVLVADFNEAAGNDVAAAIKGKFYQVNVADEAAVSAMFAQIATQHGKLDALIQTAGVLKGAYVPIEEFSVDMFHQVIDVNLIGSFLCAKHATPLLKKAGKGVIVLVTSIAATAGSSSYAYGSSKGGVSSLGITLANKLAEHNIRVNVVAPGNIDTAMKRSVIDAEAQRKGAPIEQGQYVLGEPIGVAKVLAWLVSDDADYVRGFISTR